MSLENPTSILFNTSGDEVAVVTSQSLNVSGTQPGIMIAGSGSDGNAYLLKASSAGELFVTGNFLTGSQTINGTVSVDNFPTTIDVGNFPAVTTVTSSLANPVYITGSVTATATLQPNTPVSQGNPGGISDAWNVKITDGVQVLGTGSSAPLWISGAVTANLGSFGTTTNPFYVTSSAETPVYVAFSGNLGQTAGSPLHVTGSFTANFDPSTSATVAAIASTVTGSGVTLQAANANRRGLTVYNDSSKILFVKLGAAVTTTDFSVKVSSQGYFEVPANYTGIVTGVWSGVNGFAYVTEILD